MALQIIKTEKIFYLKGQLNRTSKLMFMTYFNNVLKKENKIVVSIEDVNEIDKQGLQVLFFMMEKAEKYNKVFSIVGYGCKEIYDHYTNQVA